MNVQVLDSWEKEGYKYLKITIPGAVNQPILKVPIGSKVVQIDVLTQCPIYSNHNLKADGTCGRCDMCSSYKKACPAV